MCHCDLTKLCYQLKLGWFVLFLWKCPAPFPGCQDGAGAVAKVWDSSGSCVGSAATQQGQIFVSSWLSSSNQAQLSSITLSFLCISWKLLAPFSPFLGLKSLWCDSSTLQVTLLLWLVELESWEWRLKELGHAELGVMQNWQWHWFAPCQHCALQTGVLVTSPSHKWTSAVNQSPQKPDKSLSLILRISRLSLHKKFPGLDQTLLGIRKSFNVKCFGLNDSTICVLFISKNLHVLWRHSNVSLTFVLWPCSNCTARNSQRNKTFHFMELISHSN